MLRKLRSLSQFLCWLHHPSRQFTCLLCLAREKRCKAQNPTTAHFMRACGSRRAAVLSQFLQKKKAKTCAKTLLQAIGANGSSNPCLHHPSSTRKVPRAQTIAKKNCNCSPNASRRRFFPNSQLSNSRFKTVAGKFVFVYGVSC